MKTIGSEESVQISTEEMCARARRYERTNVRGYWVLFGVTAPFVAAFIHRVEIGSERPSQDGASGTLRPLPATRLRGAAPGAALAALGLKTWGIQSPRLLRLVKGPLPLIAIALMLSFVWFAFWKEGRKVDREIEKLSTEQAAS